MRQNREFIPGTKIIAGAVYFYSGKEEDKPKGEGTFGREGGKFVKNAVEMIPFGSKVTYAASCMKPAECETLTEGLMNAASSKIAHIRVNQGSTKFIGDTVVAGIGYIPGGKYITAATGAIGKQLDPESKSLTEGMMNYGYAWWHSTSISPESEDE